MTEETEREVDVGEPSDFLVDPEPQYQADEAEEESKESEDSEQEEPKALLVGALVRKKEIIFVVVGCPVCKAVLESQNPDMVGPLIYHNARLKVECGCGQLLEVHVAPNRNPAIVRPKEPKVLPASAIPMGSIPPRR